MPPTDLGFLGDDWNVPSLLRVRPQGSQVWPAAGPRPTVLVMVSQPSVVSWVERELAGAQVQQARSAAGVHAALAVDPEPRPQILVLEIAHASELRLVNVLRRCGWRGEVIVIGLVPPRLRAALAIAYVLPPPYSDGILADAVAGLRRAEAPAPARAQIAPLRPTLTYESGLRLEKAVPPDASKEQPAGLPGSQGQSSQGQPPRISRR